MTFQLKSMNQQEDKGDDTFAVKFGEKSDSSIDGSLLNNQKSSQTNKTLNLD